LVLLLTWPFSRKLIKRVDDLFKTGFLEMQIDTRRAEVGVTKQTLNKEDVGAAL
jgi:hypothetical protein